MVSSCEVSSKACESCPTEMEELLCKRLLTKVVNKVMIPLMGVKRVSKTLMIGATLRRSARAAVTAAARVPYGQISYCCDWHRS